MASPALCHLAAHVTGAVLPTHDWDHWLAANPGAAPVAGGFRLWIRHNGLHAASAIDLHVFGVCVRADIWQSGFCIWHCYVVDPVCDRPAAHPTGLSHQPGLGAL